MKKILTLLLTAILTFGIAGTAFAEQFDGILEPVTDPLDIQEVIYLKGSWYDMGRQYAMQQYDQLERSYMKAMSGYLASYTEEQVYEKVNGFMDGYKVTQPDMTDFVQGIADEIGISFEDAAIATFCHRMNDGVFVPKEACMHVHAWGEMTKDGHLVAASNVDENYGGNVPWPASIVAYPDAGYATISGGGINPGSILNSAGLVITYSGQKGGGKEMQTYDYMNPNSMIWYVGSHAGTVAEAQEMLQSSDLYKDGNIIVSSVNEPGASVSLENSPTLYFSRFSGDRGEQGSYLIAANHFTFEELDAYAYAPGQMDDSPIRVDTVERILLDNAGEVTVATVGKAVGSRKYYMDGVWSDVNWDLGPYSYHSPEMSDYFDKTLVRTAIDATDMTMYTLRGHYDRFTSHIPYTTAQFTKLTLADNIAKVNRTSDYDARLMAWFAGKDLTLCEEPSAEKVEYLNLANDLIQQGGTYTSMAAYAEVMGESEQALLYYGQATSCYVRAQQYAQAAQIEDNTFMAD